MFIFGTHKERAIDVSAKKPKTRILWRLAIGLALASATFASAFLTFNWGTTSPFLILGDLPIAPLLIALELGVGTYTAKLVSTGVLDSKRSKAKALGNYALIASAVVEMLEEAGFDLVELSTKKSEAARTLAASIINEPKKQVAVELSDESGVWLLEYTPPLSGSEAGKVTVSSLANQQLERGSAS